MEDLNKYYYKFTSDELNLLEQKNREFNVLYGMMESLNVVENSLGKVHKTTIELRKKVNDQQIKLGSIIFPDTLMVKLFEGIE
jgi:archaellum component FlaC